MNRFTPGVPVVLVLSAWSLAALAADEGPSTAAPVAATAAAAPATSPSPAAPVATPTKVSAAPASVHDASVRRLVCLNMSLQCFAMKPNSDDTQAKTRSASLDLKAPDIRRVVPDVQLHAPPEELEIEEQQVQVEGSRPEVYVPGGIASLPWAVMHPTQAWRIFLPVPPSAAK
jgi:hypothetical protein